jgi:hypothetical protein
MNWPSKLFAVRRRFKGLGPSPTVVFCEESALRRGDIAVEYTLNTDPFLVDLTVVRNDIPEGEEK